jgi:hypothetical protein
MTNAHDHTLTALHHHGEAAASSMAGKPIGDNDKPESALAMVVWRFECLADGTVVTVNVGPTVDENAAPTD